MLTECRNVEVWQKSSWNDFIVRLKGSHATWS